MDGYRLRRKIRLPSGWALWVCAPVHEADEHDVSNRFVTAICLASGYAIAGLVETARTVIIVLAAAILLHWFDDYAHSAPSIPAQAIQHRSQLIREARVQWGMSAPTATFAAQIHQESTWNADAVSPVGAQGLAQFMPATARWLPQVAPDTGKTLPFNPGWALRALVTYDRWLWQRVQAVTPCDRMAMTLAAYNGGLGWLQRDARLAAARGLDARRWWDNVETVNAGRSANAKRENRGYPRRILLTLEPAYMAAGWGGGMCHE